MSNYTCLNEFYDLLKIPTIDGGDEIGWSGCNLTEMQWYSWIEFHHEQTFVDDDLECYIVTMLSEPYADYMDY